MTEQKIIIMAKSSFYFALSLFALGGTGILLRALWQV